jgi:hypothetical protein
VGFAAACDTGMFARQARFFPYKDINGQGHCGTNNGESLPVGDYPYANLPRPDPLQEGAVDCNGDGIPEEVFDGFCFAEPFIFGSPTGAPNGAIAYFGERTNGRQWAKMLDRFFFQAYDIGGHHILGDMWRHMIEEYFKYYDLANADKTWPHAPADWDWGHRFDEPRKLIVFGDASLQVGGAFTNNVYGQMYDGVGGPLQSYNRYRVTCDIDHMLCDLTVPLGQKLTAQPSSSVLFETGRKLTALDTNASNGFIVNATSSNPVGLLGVPSNPQTAHLIRGIIATGQMRVRNGGTIKFY